MSHVRTISLNITDLSSLEAAAKQCGMELVKQPNYKWWGHWVQDYHDDDAAYKHGIDPKDYGKCEYALRVVGNSDAYEVGVVKKPDGQPGYSLIWDFYGTYGRMLEQAIGENGSKLRQEYSLQVAAKEMARKGFRTSREFNTVTNKPRLRAWR